MFRWRPVLWWLLTAALAWATWDGAQRLPDRHKPWKPLAFEDPPGWLTRYKLARLDADACHRLLETTPLVFKDVPDTNTPGGCELRGAVRISRTSLRLGSPVTLSCRAAVSLALWERHVVEPAAMRELGQPVQRLDHLGSLACRNVNGSPQGRRSQHASADALDVEGFVLAGGRRVTVARDWQTGGAESRFLGAVHDGACAFFDDVLGPGYNAAHRNHFHLDRGPYRLCR